MEKTSNPLRPWHLIKRTTANLIARPLSRFNTPNQTSRSFRISRRSFHRAPFEARNVIIIVKERTTYKNKSRYKAVFLPLFPARFSSVSSLILIDARVTHKQHALRIDIQCSNKAFNGDTTGFTLYADDAQPPRLFQLSLKYHVVQYVRSLLFERLFYEIRRLNERDD